MLDQYKNIEQILLAKKSISAQRIDTVQLQNINSNFAAPVYFDNTIINKSTVEFHLYSGDVWISGQHKSQSLPNTPVYFNSIDNTEIRFDSQPYVLDIYQELQDLKTKELTNISTFVSLEYLEKYPHHFDKIKTKIHSLLNE